MRRLLSACLAFVVGTLASPLGLHAQAKRGGARVDWSKVPAPKLPGEVDAAVRSLQPRAHGTRAVVLPFAARPSKLNAWRIEAYAQRCTKNALRAAGVELVDEKPLIFDAKTRKRGRTKKGSTSVTPYAELPRIQRSTRALAAMRKKAGVDFILVGKCNFATPHSAITFRIYAGETLRVVASTSIKLRRSELTIERNTPQTNRRILQWAVSQLGEKVDRGECWDLANRAFRQAGVRRPGGALEWGLRLEAWHAILPGDIVQRGPVKSRGGSTLPLSALSFARASCAPCTKIGPAGKSTDASSRTRTSAERACGSRVSTARSRRRVMRSGVMRSGARPRRPSCGGLASCRRLPAKARSTRPAGRAVGHGSAHRSEA